MELPNFTSKHKDFNKTGAPGRSRTHNLLIRSQALYPLSYWGVTAIIPDL